MAPYPALLPALNWKNENPASLRMGGRDLFSGVDCVLRLLRHVAAVLDLEDDRWLNELD